MAVTVSKKNIRDRLIDETIREIGKNGPGQISLRRIAAACGVTHATAYKHFENKQDLIATCKKRISKRVQAYTLRSARRAQEPCVGMCKAYLHYMTRHPQFYSLLHSSAGTAESAAAKAAFRKTYAAQYEIIQDFLSRCGIPEAERPALIRLIDVLLNGLIAILLSHTLGYDGKDITELVDLFVFDALRLRPSRPA